MPGGGVGQRRRPTTSPEGRVERGTRNGWRPARSWGGREVPEWTAERT